MTRAIRGAAGAEAPSEGGPVVLRRSSGRLRVAVSSADPARLESTIRAAPGVRSASFSSQTRNLLVTFDPRRTDEEAVLDSIAAARSQPETASSAAVSVQGVETDPGWIGAEGTCRFAAEPSECVKTILDFASYPRWQEYVTSVELLERDRRGRGSLVRTDGNVAGHEVYHVMRYRYPSPTRVAWEQVQGELEAVRGEWRFRAAGGGATRATLRLEVRLTLPQRLLLRGPLFEQVRSTLINHALGELGARVEAAGR